MSTAHLEEGPTSLKPGRGLGSEIAALKSARDNRSNFYHLAKVYTVMLGAIALTVWFIEYQMANGLWFFWSILAVIASAFIVGASQHQLAGATHEATHFILFRDRRLNELVSDWLCMFPLYSTTYQFRLHHLAHHQFVNDPERDPDFTQLRDSGHDLDFPLAHIDFIKALLHQLWLPNLVRYTLTRARYNGLGVEHNPYRKQDDKGSRIPNAVIGLYAIVLPILLGFAKPFIGSRPLVGAFLAVGLVAAGYLATLPEERYPASHIRPEISHRTTAISRIAFFSLLYASLSMVEATTTELAWNYYLALWILPLFTTFPLFMIMRQWVQHGNADRGRLTNTRVFLVNPALRYAVFPFGMDYHLPHHIVAAVPHFKLPALHELLLARDPAYAKEGVVVEGYFRSPAPERGNPTVAEVLGPKYARAGSEVFIASDTLEDAHVANPDAIELQERLSREGKRTNA